MKRDSSSLLLLEMTLAVLFFALSAAVILQVFIGAHRKSVQSEVVATATLLCEDAVNAMRASQREMDVFFTRDGYTKTDRGYEKQVTVNDRRYTLSFTGREHRGEAGVLILGEIAAYYAGDPEPAHSMGAACFYAGGAGP
ncbi:MAG: hypothetical protein FWF47_00715 [Clostridia bacterium]|nr:hypothetical protein [Clostridia bacterium]